jgi:hypothetical protein
MRKAFTGAVAAAIMAGLVLNAPSEGATAHRAVSSLGDGTAAVAARVLRVYEGHFQDAGPGSEIVINTAFRNGEAKSVKRMRYRVLMDCEQSGNTQGAAGWIFEPGIRVRADRRFSVSGNNGQNPVSNLTFKGRFSRNFARVKGTLKTHQWFAADPGQGLPAEYCTLPTTVYTAKR